MAIKMTRLWRPYWEWECYKHGMWDRVPRDKEPYLIQAAVEFTGDAELYGEWMLRAVREFHASCEHHLTEDGINKQAYIGHAACAMALRLPEYIVRRAWGMLTQEQRDAANAKASDAFLEWQRSRIEHGGQLDFRL